MKKIHKDLLNQFLKHLTAERNYSENTIISYKNDIEQFFEYIEGIGKDYKSLDRLTGRAYLSYLKENDYKKTSLERKVAVIKSFDRFLVSHNFVQKNNFLYLRGPKRDKKIPTFLDENEMFDFLNVIKGDDIFSFRDKSILEIFYATGIRISELTSLKKDDINFVNGTIKVIGKGNKERIVPIGDISLSIIKEYLRLRDRSATFAENKFLFINRKGTHITVRSIRRIVEKYIKLVSTDKQVSPHTIRHTFATHLINAGCDLKSIQEMLGHVSLQTTQIYTHLEIDRLKKEYIKAHPHS